MTTAGKALYKQLSSHLVAKLMFRLGVRKVVALGLVLVLLPLVLATLGGELVCSVGKSERR